MYLRSRKTAEVGKEVRVEEETARRPRSWYARQREYHQAAEARAAARWGPKRKGFGLLCGKGDMV